MKKILFASLLIASVSCFAAPTILDCEGWRVEFDDEVKEMTIRGDGWEKSFYGQGDQTRWVWNNSRIKRYTKFPIGDPLGRMDVDLDRYTGIMLVQRVSYGSDSVLRESRRTCKKQAEQRFWHSLIVWSYPLGHLKVGYEIIEICYSFLFRYLRHCNCTRKGTTGFKLEFFCQNSGWGMLAR